MGLIQGYIMLTIQQLIVIILLGAIIIHYQELQNIINDILYRNLPYCETTLRNLLLSYLFIIPNHLSVSKSFNDQI